MKWPTRVIDDWEEVAFSGSHAETVHRPAWRGDIPAYKMGKDWRFYRVVLQKWMGNQHLRQTRPWILVVDDAPLVTGIIKYILIPRGYVILWDGDGWEWLALYKDNVVDLILLCLRLPDLDGPEFYSRIPGSWSRALFMITTELPDSHLVSEVVKHGPVVSPDKSLIRNDLIREVRPNLGRPYQARVHQ